MNEFLSKFIRIINKIINNEKIPNIDIDREEYLHFFDILVSLEYLLCYPDDNTFHNNELADNTIRNNLMYNKSYFIESDEYKKEIKTDKKLSSFVETNEQQIDIPIKERLYNFIKYSYFIKDDKFVHKFAKFEENTMQYKTITISFYKDQNNPKSIYASLKYKVPLIIREQHLELFSKDLTYNEETGTYFLNPIPYVDNTSRMKLVNTIKYNGSNIEKIARVNNYYIKGTKFEYFKLNNDLIIKEFKNSNEYKTYFEESKNLNKFLIINKDGNIVDNNLVNSGVILHQLRLNIAHNKDKCTFTIKHNDFCDFDGMFFIIDQRAVIVPFAMYNSLADICKLNFDETENVFSYIYAPKLSKAINNSQACIDYLNNCKKINIQNNKGLNKQKIDLAIVHYLKQFEKNNLPSDSIGEYLKENINNVFPNTKVFIHDLANIELFSAKLSSNPFFLKEKNPKNQVYCIIFLLEKFYNFSITNTSALLSNNKSNYITFSNKYLLLIIDKIFNLINLAIEKKHYENKFALLKDEIYIALCAILIYTNLIRNNFASDLKVDETDLNRIDRIDLEKKLTKDLFKNFTLVNDSIKGNRKNSTPENINEFKHVIALVRNSIAHANLKIKFTKTYNHEDIFLIFDDALRSNMHYKISCKDFLTFITNPLFFNYKELKDEKLNLNSYDELIKLVKEKIES